MDLVLIDSIKCFSLLFILFYSLFFFNQAIFYLLFVMQTNVLESWKKYDIKFDAFLDKGKRERLIIKFKLIIIKFKLLLNNSTHSHWRTGRAKNNRPKIDKRLLLTVSLFSWWRVNRGKTVSTSELFLV